MDFAFRVPAYAGQAEPPRSASRSPRPATARLHVLIQVSLKKIVQEGANESDGGKLANIASEVGELDKAAEGFLKSFTSGDTMQFDRKYKAPFHAVPTARAGPMSNTSPASTLPTFGPISR